MDRGLYAEEILGEERVLVFGVHGVGGAERVLEFADAICELLYLLMEVLGGCKDESVGPEYARGDVR